MPVTDLLAVRQAISLAKGLPNAHYIDPALYEEEKQALLFDQWAGLGVAADVPTPGDALLRFFLSFHFCCCATERVRCECFKIPAVTVA